MTEMFVDIFYIDIAIAIYIALLFILAIVISNPVELQALQIGWRSFNKL